MEYKKQLIGRIESFYVDVVEEFKEAELQIMADSKFRSIFKKKDYDGNIAKLRSCKKTHRRSVPPTCRSRRRIRQQRKWFVFLRQAYASSMRCATPISVCRML